MSHGVFSPPAKSLANKIPNWPSARDTTRDGGVLFQGTAQHFESGSDSNHKPPFRLAGLKVTVFPKLSEQNTNSTLETYSDVRGGYIGLH
jgi:hypothetical protein